MTMRTKLRHWNVDTLVRRKLKIDPKPGYQRDPVWPPAKQQLLIDTLLREYDIPKIYLRKLPDGAPFEHEVADGQQRLRAIWDFVAGNFALGEASETVPGFGDLSGKKHSQLPSEATDKLGLYEITVVEIDDATDVEIRDLFLRLQEGVTLNPAEKRNAMIGTMRDFVATLARTHRVFPLTAIRPRRNAWDDLAAHVTCAEIAAGMTDLKATDLKKMYLTEAAFDIQEASAKKVKRTLNIMERVLKDSPPEMDIKWGFVDLYLAISSLDNDYVLTDREADLLSFYLSFEAARRSALVRADASVLLQSGKTQWDKDLYDYIQAFEKDGAKKENIKKRHEIYIRAILWAVPDLAPKDTQRAFSRDQRVVIWRRDGEMCQSCQNPVSFDYMHADHVVPHSLGGETTVCNGQTLCAACNLSKGASMIP